MSRREDGPRHLAVLALLLVGREAVLVGVDTSTRIGSTYLEDSPVTGAFDTFLSGRGLDALDAALPTLRRREARQMASYGADWSPDAGRPRGFAWPFDLATGRADEP